MDSTQGHSSDIAAADFAISYESTVHIYGRLQGYCYPFIVSTFTSLLRERYIFRVTWQFMH